MPTYRNDTGTRITHQDKNRLSWQPGQTRELPFFVPHEELGLTLVSEEPWVLRGDARGFGFATLTVEANADLVWRVPYSHTVEITVHASKPVLMRIGDCLVPIMVDPEHYHVSRYPWDMVGYLTFSAGERTVVLIKAEPFTERGV